MTERDVADLIGDDLLDRFNAWMYGQTLALCEGRLYNHDAGEYEKSCNGEAHGPVYYWWDVARFVNGQPIVD